MHPFPTLASLDCTVDRISAEGDIRDRALVERCLKGDELAATQLVDQYHRPLFNVALRMLGNIQDAEDVTQTVFGNAFGALERYDQQHRFFSWVYRMAVNESLNALGRRRRMVTLDADAPISVPGLGPDRAVEAGDRVSRALMELRPDDRAVVVLRHFASFSYTEIAAVLEIPESVVKSRLFTARQRLRMTLIEQESR
jgi:RNA polymerase sigma-70 factor, ECF subfamily